MAVHCRHFSKDICASNLGTSSLDPEMRFPHFGRGVLQKCCANARKKSLIWLGVRLAGRSRDTGPSHIACRSGSKASLAIVTWAYSRRTVKVFRLIVTIAREEK